MPKKKQRARTTRRAAKKQRPKRPRPDVAPVIRTYDVPRPAHRPSSYKPEYAQIAAELCRLGATDMEVGRALGVSWRTVMRWRVQFPEFCQATKTGKDAADERVISSLYARATGYTHEQDEIHFHEGRPIVVRTEKHYAPETVAAIFWLKNRRPEEFRDRREVDATVRHSDTLEELTDEEIMEGIRKEQEARARAAAAAAKTDDKPPQP